MSVFDAATETGKAVQSKEILQGTYRILQLVRSKVRDLPEMITNVEVVQNFKGKTIRGDVMTVPAEITDPIQKSIIMVEGNYGPLFYKTVTNESDLLRARQLFDRRRDDMAPSPLQPIFVELISPADRESGKIPGPTIKANPPKQTI